MWVLLIMFALICETETGGDGMSKKKYTKKQMEDEIDRRIIEAENWRITHQRLGEMESAMKKLEYRVKLLEGQSDTAIPQTQCGRV